MTLHRPLLAASLCVTLLLCACGSSSTPGTASDDFAVEVNGARLAIFQSTTLLTTVSPLVRSGPLLSIYVNLMLADGQMVPVTAAMDGVNVQLKLHAQPSEENIDDLYSLLEEFGAVLHINVPDLLNRSDDRTTTLDEYETGLKNITERSQRRSDDLKEQIATMKTQQSTQRSAVSSINKEISAAVKANDFATAQDKQKSLLDAQTELTKSTTQLQEWNSIQTTFGSLLSIASQRIAALDSNRELLIAGLKAVDVPGVNDLGVIQGKGRSSTGGGTGGFSPFGGL